MSKRGLYIHVPFCAVKCPYCDFYSLPYRRNAAEEYTAAVSADLRETAALVGAEPDGRAADTLYFGGGTPSLLPPELLGRLIGTAREAFALDADAEVTLEANPNTVSPRRLSLWRAMGVNRLSLGMQSADGGELSALGRRHSPEGAAEAVRAAVREGIENVSLDVMLGTPGQTPQSLRQTLELAVSLPVSHLSAYLLKVEPGTPYWESPLLSRCMDEDALADAYLEMVDFLRGKGFLQYEISNFAKPGWESRHNLKYWRCEEYLGFGPSAHSFFRGRRTGYPRDLASYAAADPKRSCERLTDGRAGGLAERMMLRLRLTEGIPLSMLEGIPAQNRGKLLEKASRFAAAGYAVLAGERLLLTPGGFLVSNEILAELLQYVPDRPETAVDPC